MPFKDTRELVNHTMRAVQATIDGVWLLDDDVEELSKAGLSSIRTQSLLYRLAHRPEHRHLEVGMFTGTTFFATGVDSAMKELVGIDNWQLDVRDKFWANHELFKNALCPHKIYEEDCWEIDKKKLGKFDSYFYDGCHGLQEQHNALVHFWDNLEDLSVVVIDDYKELRVQRGTMRALEELGIKYQLVYGFALPGGFKWAKELFWNGLGVFCFDKTRTAGYVHPRAERIKDL